MQRRGVELLTRLSHPTIEDQRTLATAAFRQPPPRAVFDTLMAIISRATPEHIERAAESMRQFNRITELEQLRMPALLICGNRDRHVPLRNDLATHQAIPRCGLQVYFEIGHVPFMRHRTCSLTMCGAFLTLCDV